MDYLYRFKWNISEGSWLKIIGSKFALDSNTSPIFKPNQVYYRTVSNVFRMTGYNFLDSNFF